MQDDIPHFMPLQIARRTIARWLRVVVHIPTCFLPEPSEAFALVILTFCPSRWPICLAPSSVLYAPDDLPRDSARFDCIHWFTSLSRFSIFATALFTRTSPRGLLACSDFAVAIVCAL